MTSSVFGGLASSLVLMFCAPLLASFALKSGPPEYFMLGVLGIATVLGMAGKNSWKHFLSMGFGLWLSFIGVSTSTGMTRFTFGAMSLMDGIPLVPRNDRSVWYPFCSEDAEKKWDRNLVTGMGQW